MALKSSLGFLLKKDLDKARAMLKSLGTEDHETFPQTERSLQESETEKVKKEIVAYFATARSTGAMVLFPWDWNMISSQFSEYEKPFREGIDQTAQWQADNEKEVSASKEHPMIRYAEDEKTYFFSGTGNRGTAYRNLDVARRIWNSTKQGDVLFVARGTAEHKPVRNILSLRHRTYDDFRLAVQEELKRTVAPEKDTFFTVHPVAVFFIEEQADEFLAKWYMGRVGSNKKTIDPFCSGRAQ